MRSFIPLLSFVILSLALMSCAGEVDSKIEEIQRHLDSQEYAQAEAKARGVLAEDEDHVRAKFYLAGALIGQSVLKNQTYLELLARLLEDPSGPEQSNTETFVRVSSALDMTPAAFDQLREATNTLASITLSTVPQESFSRDISLQLYMTKLFEIAAELENIGATSEDNVCNANESITNPDGVPDEFDASQMEEDDEERFQNNIETADSHRQDAGLSDDFALSDRLTTMALAIVDAGSVENFLNQEFGVTGVCP